MCSDVMTLIFLFINMFSCDFLYHVLDGHSNIWLPSHTKPEIVTWKIIQELTGLSD